MGFRKLLDEEGIVANILGQKVKILRKRDGLTLEKLAQEIESTKSYVWELENKDSIRPSADKVFKLADALGVTAEYLVDDTGILEPTANVKDAAFINKFKKLDEKDKETLKKFIDSI